jgi:hypothetical protein
MVSQGKLLVWRSCTGTTSGRSSWQFFPEIPFASWEKLSRGSQVDKFVRPLPMVPSFYPKAPRAFVTTAMCRLASDRDTSVQSACDEPIEYPLLVSGLDDAVLQRDLLELAFSCFADFAFGWCDSPTAAALQFSLPSPHSPRSRPTQHLANAASETATSIEELPLDSHMTCSAVRERLYSSHLCLGFDRQPWL